MMVTGSFVETIQDMMGAVVERTPKIEQVNLTGGRLIREAKVICCWSGALLPEKIHYVVPQSFYCV